MGVASALAASVVALGAAPASAAPAAQQAGAVGSVTGTWTAPGGRSGPINATISTPTATVGANGTVVLGADITMTAVGTRAPSVTKRVAVPTSVTSSAAPGTSTGLVSADAIPVPAGCNVLNLVLGPINLNLLGLVVVLQQVTLDIVAVPGPGNLLGNLLCAIVGLIPAPPVVA